MSMDKMINNVFGGTYNKKLKCKVRQNINVNGVEAIRYHIKTVDGYSFLGDFYGLLQVIGVPQEIWLEVMSLNNINHPSEYDGTLTSILTYSERSKNLIL